MARDGWKIEGVDVWYGRFAREEHQKVSVVDLSVEVFGWFGYMLSQGGLWVKT